MLPAESGNQTAADHCTVGSRILLEACENLVHLQHSLLRGMGHHPVALPGFLRGLDAKSLLQPDAQGIIDSLHTK